MMHRTNNTFSIHHFNGGWLDENACADNRKTVEMYEELVRRSIKVDESVKTGNAADINGEGA